MHSKVIVRVDYDTHPEEVMERVQTALRQVGISCEMLEPERDDQTHLDWEITTPNYPHE